MSQHIIFAGLLTAAILLLSGCSRDDESVPSSGPGKQPEIRVDADIWQMMDATRAAGATTYDTDVLHTEGFTCTVYEQNTTTKYEEKIPIKLMAQPSIGTAVAGHSVMATRTNGTPATLRSTSSPIALKMFSMSQGLPIPTISQHLPMP